MAMSNGVLNSHTAVVPEPLLTLAATLNQNPSLAVQLEQIAQTAAELTGSDHADIALFDPFLRRSIPARSSRVFMHQGDDDADAWIRSNRTHLVVPDLNYAAGENDLTMFNRDIASYLGVPVMKDGTVDAALLIFNRLPSSFENGEIELLTALGHFARLAIDHHRVTNDLAETSRILLRLSLTDPATGVATRNQLDQLLSREWQRAENEGLKLALMHVQVQQAGNLDQPDDAATDELALARTARILQASLYRSRDVIARSSASQLTVLLPETDEGGAVAIARRLRRDVQQLTAESGGDCAQTSLQIGISTYDALSMRRGPRFRPEDLMRQASLALDTAAARGTGDHVSVLHLH